MQDTLSDMLVRIKNAQRAKKQKVVVFFSKFNQRICDVLIEEGFIERYEIVHEDNKPFVEITLKYYAGEPVIQQIKRVSKSCLRVYARARNIPKNIEGFGIMLVSTSKGIMSHIKAKQANLGGELICIVS